MILGSFLVSRLKDLNQQTKKDADEIAEETLPGREVINPMNSIDVAVVEDLEAGSTAPAEDYEEEDEEELTPPLKINLVELSNVAPKQPNPQVLLPMRSDDDILNPFHQESLW